MSKVTRTGHFLSVAALAASTALSGPLAAYAQDAAQVRVAQAPEELVQPPAAAPEAPAEPEAPAPEAAEPEAPVEPEAPAPEAVEPEAAEPEAPAEPEPAEPEPAAEPEAPAEPEAVEPEPAVEPEAPAEPEAVEPEAPVEPEPAAEPEPAVEPEAVEPEVPVEPEAPAEPESSVPAPEDTAPAADAPEGEAEDLPVDEGTESDVEAAPEATDDATEEAAPTSAPEAETPAAEPEADAPVGEPEADAPNAVDGETETGVEGEADTTAEDADSAAEGESAAPVEGEAGTSVEGETEVPAEGEATTPAEGEVPAPLEGEVEATTEGEAPAEASARRSLAAPEEPLEQPEPVDAELQNITVDTEGNIADRDAQVQNIDNSVTTINSVTNIQGNRIETAPQVVLPPQVEVVERVGNRDILTFAGAALAGAAAGAVTSYFIRSDDTERLRGDSQEFYVEELPRGQYRETIVRDNGVQVVTIYNDYGDVVQRSRILPDGREVVLFYDPALEEASEPVYYYDVGASLPPLELTIPEERYIVDVAEPDEELYYETIIAPPVETVERIYSIDEVRRSERIRDKVRRIDLNTVTFAFGSAEIEQSEVENLQALADAIARVLEQSPDETFLLEGHTDAVGSNVANLALSDERADSVAVALTQYFDIPPENLVTQGYGEENLKVDTEAENRENRRVTLRRITPLVKPVAVSQAN